MGAMWSKILGAGVVIVAAAAVGAWVVTKPDPHPNAYWAGLGQPDLANGEKLFWAGGCASCHAANGASGDAVKTLAGGAPCRALSAHSIFPTSRPMKRPVSAHGHWPISAMP